MKVLLFTSKEEDYLQDSIIHGFKMLFGKNAVEYPTKGILYEGSAEIKKIRGNGFTLYGLLDGSLKNEQETGIGNVIRNNDFDLIVFTSIYRQYELFYKHYEMLIRKSIPIWIMDGEDTGVLFPYLGKHIRQFLFSSKPHKNFLYFKRELFQATVNSIYFRIPVSRFEKYLLPKNIKPVSFSIPAEKICTSIPLKTKMFASHIVDAEVEKVVRGSTVMRQFECEKEYYADIHSSRFGITTKRSGWDCLRHYEIAANGAVVCFKDLDKKPVSCAPHGLLDGVNCISYVNSKDLINKVNNLSDEAYMNLQKSSLNWIKENSTIARVNSLIKNYYRKVY